MELEIKETKILEDGKHEGKIVAVEYRDTPYKYTDVVISVTDPEQQGFQIKYGSPTNDGTKSKLVKLLGKFISIVPGLKVDPEKVLIGKTIEFMTLAEETKTGTFVKVVEGSIKPIS